VLRHRAGGRAEHACELRIGGPEADRRLRCRVAGHRGRRGQGKGQSVELQATECKVHGFVDDPDTYPISPKQHSFEYLREQSRTCRARTNTFGAVARVRHCLAMAVHRFFHEQGFLWVHTPIITGSDCEGAGDRCSA
jgi:aspartyl/asparaginyl-tRNA synthetase